MTRWIACALALVFLVALTSANAEVKAWLDDPDVAPGDTVQLTLEREGQTSSRPDLTPLKQDFDILDSRSSTNFQIINGRTSSGSEIVLTLSPKHSGRLTVPAISWGAERTSPLTLNVATAGGTGNHSSAPGRIFLENEVDPKEPLVQAAARLTVRIYAAEPLYRGDLDFPAGDGVLVRQIGSDEHGTAEKNGQSYQLLTRHYLIFPQRSGQLTIPGPTLNGEVATRPRAQPTDPFSGFFAGSPFSGSLSTLKPVRAHGSPIVLDVRPRPADAPATYWLPARNVTLSGEWHPEQARVHIGDPITVDLHVQAEDLTAAQLPDLSTLLALPDGLKAYPDQPKLNDVPQGGSLLGTRDQSIALVADQPGQFTIPELRLSWWDTQSNTAREVTVPARTLTVLPAAGSTPARAAAVTPSRSKSLQAGAGPSGTNSGTSRQPALYSESGAIPWRWVSVALGLLWLATICAWIWSHKRRAAARGSVSGNGQTSPRSSAEHSHTRAAFRDACRHNDPLAARRSLLVWANRVQTAPRIVGLGALANLLKDPTLTPLLRELDRACYAGGSWNGDKLANALSELRLPKRVAANERTSALAPLYR